MICPIIRALRPFRKPRAVDKLSHVVGARRSFENGLSTRLGATSFIKNACTREVRLWM
jgi:hypothetical protein